MSKITKILTATAATAMTTVMAGAVALSMSSPSLAQSKTTLWLEAGNNITAGQRALLNNNTSRAIKLLNKGLKRELPEHLRVAGLSDLCIAYQKQGDADAATKACDEAIKLNPRFWRAYNNRANISYAQQDYLSALGDYEAALALNPSAWQIRHNIDLIRTRYTTAK